MTGGVSRLDARFAALKAAGRGGLVTFVTAGDPDPETFAAILSGLFVKQEVGEQRRAVPANE